MDSNGTKKWSDEVKMGDFTLKSRVCMAALTRQRCDPKDGVPTDLVVEYYLQRAGAGMILTEASAWSPRGEAFPGAANIFTKQQAEGWKRVIEAVHKKGTKIFLQIFHAGRATHSKINGFSQVWAPSPIAVRQNIRVLENQPYPVPKQMSLEEIKQTQEQFKSSIILAKEAGFDGVQIHAAHGYLVDSFLRTSSNERKDSYGGNPENRSRFCLQIIDIALEYFKPYQLGVKLSPVSRLKDMFDENPIETYSHLLKQLSKRQIGFAELKQPNELNFAKCFYTITPAQQIEHVCKTLRPYFTGVVIANSSFNPETGLEIIQKGDADMVSFGRLYVSNPDLAERILKNQKVNDQWDFKTFYGFQFGAQGYTDYPFFEDGKQE